MQKDRSNPPEENRPVYSSNAFMEFIRILISRPRLISVAVYLLLVTAMGIWAFFKPLLSAYAENGFSGVGSLIEIKTDDTVYSLLETSVDNGAFILADMLLLNDAARNKFSGRLNIDLNQSIRDNELAYAAFLLENGADPDFTGFGGYTPLLTAVSDLNIEAVEQLLESGANPELKTAGHGTPLFKLMTERIMTGDEEENKIIRVAELLLNKGADINTRHNRSGDDKSILDVIVKNYFVHPGRIEFLLANGISMDVHPSVMFDLFISVVKAGSVSAVEKMVAKGVDINGTNKSGDTPLMAASTAYKNRMRLIEFLLSRDANINTARENGWSALMDAVSGNHTDAAEFLLENRANPDQGADLYIDGRTHWSSPPIFLASYNRNIEMMDILLAHGANINLKNERQMTPLLYIAGIYKDKLHEEIAAWDSDYFGVLKHLVEKGADVNIRTDYNRNALMHAVDKPEVLEFLIKSGSDLDVKDRDGDTALMYTAESGFDESAEILIEHGADLNIKNKKGMTALDWASIKASAQGNYSEKEIAEINSMKEKIYKLLEKELKNSSKQEK